MKLFKKIYSFVIFIQFVLFVIYVISNITNLTSINYDVSILGENYNFTINFYSIIGIIGAFMGIIFLISINILDSGLNEEGTKNVAKFLSFMGVISILTITNIYYILQFGLIGMIIEITILISYLFYAIDFVNSDNVNIQ